MFRKSTLLAVAFTFAAFGSSITPSVAFPGNVAITKISNAQGAGSSAGSSSVHTIWGVKIPQVTAPSAGSSAGTSSGHTIWGVKIPQLTPPGAGLGSKITGIDKLKLPPPGPILPGGGSTPPPTGSTPKPGDHDHPWGGPVVIVAPPSESPVVVPSTTVVDQPATVVAPRFTSTRSTAIGRAATSEPCNCLTKQYLADGSVVFQDLCTKEAAIAKPAALNAQVQAPQAQ